MVEKKKKEEKSKYFYGKGRRKEAVAMTRLFEDEDKRLINKMELEKYLPELSMQKDALAPLELMGEKKFGFTTLTRGGGKKAQAEAVSLSIARALLKYDESLRKTLKSKGLLKRDPRMKERKKPGLRGARRAPQFSKR